jgi:acetylornithine/succinyldiaminopimelate/putrescine aminotransferase
MLDMTMAWGAALVGHAQPKVVEAATRQAALGGNFAAVNRRAVELAERLAAICALCRAHPFRGLRHRGNDALPAGGTGGHRPAEGAEV